MTEAQFITVENWDVRVHGRVYTIPKMELRVYPNGERGISLDEYNKVLRYIYEQDKRNSKSKILFE